MSSRDVRPCLLVIHWGRRGGGSTFSLEMARALVAEGTFRVVTSYNSESEIVQDWGNLPNAHLAVPTYARSWEVIAYTPRLIRNIVRLLRFLRREKVQVIYSPMFNLWQSIAIWAVRWRVHVVASVHDASAHPGDESWANSAMQRLELDAADQIVTYSSAVRNALERDPDRRHMSLINIHHGVSAGESTARRLRTSGSRRVAFFGRILAYKGLPQLIDAVSMLNASGFPIRLEVWGDGDVSVEEIESASSQVDWHLGWVDEDRVDAVLDGVDLVVLPYQEASQSGVLARAIGRGLPVVVTPVGGLSEQVEQSGAGIVSRSTSAEDIAVAIRECLSDPAQYAAMSAHGIRAAQENLSWGAAAVALVSQLERVR